MAHPHPDGSSAVKNKIRQGRHDRLGRWRHQILGWPEARADPTSGTQRLVSYLVSITPSGSRLTLGRLRGGEAFPYTVELGDDRTTCAPPPRRGLTRAARTRPRARWSATSRPTTCRCSAPTARPTAATPGRRVGSAAALRSAQLERHPDQPRIWAGFVLSGAWR
jgi:hypothetical protein